MHPVIYCEWPCWNDGVWCLIYQPLIVTCCMPYRPLHVSKQHSQHQHCYQVMTVSPDKPCVRCYKRECRANCSTCVQNVCSLQCHYALNRLQSADCFGRSNYATNSILCSIEYYTQRVSNTSCTMGDAGQTGSALLLFHVAIYLRTETSWRTWQHDTGGRTVMPSTVGNHIHTLNLRWHQK